jgi:hypothetical protein
MNKHEINECHNFWEADMDADIVVHRSCSQADSSSKFRAFSTKT